MNGLAGIEYYLATNFGNEHHIDASISNHDHLFDT